MLRAVLKSVAVLFLVGLWTIAAPPALAQEKAAEKHEEPAASKKDSADKKDATKESEKKDAEHAAPGAAHPEQAHGGSHAGGHHDPYDLTHQNASRMMNDPSEWKSDLSIASLIVFLVLLALLSKFAWKPIMDGLQKREQAIAQSIQEAKHSAELAALQLRQYEARLAAATEEARGIVDQARKDAEVAKERILVEAQDVAKRERQRAVEDINLAKTQALQEITQKSVDLAVSLAGRLIRKQLQPEDHSQLIREMVDQFPSRN